MVTDNEILEAYMLGWTTAYGQVAKKVYNNPILTKAFELGYWDYVFGDDISTLDLQGDEQILKRIKDETRK